MDIDNMSYKIIFFSHINYGPGCWRKIYYYVLSPPKINLETNLISNLLPKPSLQHKTLLMVVRLTNCNALAIKCYHQRLPYGVLMWMRQTMSKSKIVKMWIAATKWYTSEELSNAQQQVAGTWQAYLGSFVGLFSYRILSNFIGKEVFYPEYNQAWFFW
jgi:hypothetical protein